MQVVVITERLYHYGILNRRKSGTYDHEQDRRDSLPDHLFLRYALWETYGKSVQCHEWFLVCFVVLIWYVWCHWKVTIILYPFILLSSL